MAGSIANLNVRLIADIGGFAAGMTSAIKPLTGFVGSIASAATGVGALVTAITGLAAGGASLAGLAELTHKSMESIDVVAKLSDRLGISTEALTGLQHGASLAGIGAEELTGGLEKMLKSLGEAASAGGPAADALERMGLSAKDLANESPDAAFKQIADGIANIQNPVERATAAVEIFGKSGQSLLPLLMSGAEGIAQAQQEADKLGLSFSRVDAHQVEEANDAITRLKSIFTGIGNQLAIQLAPIIEAVASKLVEWASAGDGIKGLLGGAIKFIAFTVAAVGDTLMSVADWAWGTFQKRAEEACISALQALKGVFNWLAQLEEKTTGTTIFKGLASGVDVLIESQKDSIKMKDAVLEAWRNNSLSDSVSKFFQDVDNKAAKTAAELNKKKISPLGDDFLDNVKKIQGVLADLQKQVDQFGMTDAQKKVDDLKHLEASPEQLAKATGLQQQLDAMTQQKKTADDVKKVMDDLAKSVAQVNMSDGDKKLDDLKRIGASPEQIASVRRLANQLDALEEQKKAHEEMQKDAAQLFTETMTPLEKYQNELDKLNTLLNEGLISWETYGRGVAKAKDELSKAEDQHAQALTVGSAEAARAAYDRTRGASMANDMPRQHMELARRADRFLDNIERNTAKIGTASDTEVMDI